MSEDFDQPNAITITNVLSTAVAFLTVMLCPSASSLDLGGVMSYAPHSVIKATTPSLSLSSFLILTVSCSMPSHKQALMG